jgi:hypothetical protein
MNLKAWFNKTIREETLAVLEGLASHFKDQQGNFDWRKAVEVFTGFCDNNPVLTKEEQEVVNEVIKALGLTEEVASLRAFWQKIPAPLRDITKSLENYKGPITWKVLGEDDKVLSYGNLAGPLGSLIGYKALASLDVSLQALDSSAASNAVGLTCNADERYLKMGLAGKLELMPPGGILPLGFLAIKGSADITGTANLDYYFLNKAKWLFIEAMVHDVPHLASLFDAEDNAAEQAYHLDALHLNVVGTLNTSVGLGVDKSWGTSFNIESDALELDSEVSLGTKLTTGMQAGVLLKGAWDVLVKPRGNRILSVKVQKTQSTDKSTAFSLNAQVGLSGLDAVGDAFIKKYLPDPGDLLGKLNEFANFGSLLKKEVETHLDQLLKIGPDDTLEQELIEVVVGDENAAGLAEAIGSAVETALNKRLDLLATKAEDAGKQIAQDIAELLHLPSYLEQKWMDQTAGQITKLVEDIKANLETQLKTIIAGYKGELADLFKPLESIGKAVTDFSADVDQLSRQLLEPVIDLLTKYQQQRNKIVQVVRDSARLKLELLFSRVCTSFAAKTTILEFEVDSGNEKAREYYKEMVAGNYTNALAAARKSKEGSDGIKLTGGSFQDTVTSNLTTDITFHIFGAQINSKTILDSKVQVRLDISGNVLAADSIATMDKTCSAFGESWEVTFINMMELAGIVPPGTRGSGEPGTTGNKLFASSLDLTYKDDNLKKEELDAYLGSLKGTGLLAENLQAAVDSRYTELDAQAKSQKKKMGAKIGLSLSLTSRDIQNLLDTGDEDIRLTAIRNQVKTYFSNTKKREAFDEVLGKWYDRSRDEIGQIKKIAAVGRLGDALIRYDIKDINDRRDMNTVSIPDRHYIHIAHRIGTNAANLVEIVHNMRSAAAMQFTETSLDDNVKTLNQYNKTTNKSLKDWLEIRGILSSLGIGPGTVPPVTLAFIATIGELCRLGQNGIAFLTPTVSWSVLDWNKPEIFV